MNLILLVSASLVSATTLIYPALGETFTELSGVYNIGLEGIMLISASTSFVGTAYSGSVIAGLVIGIVTGMLAGFIQGIFAVNFRADQIVFGLGIILLGPFLSPVLKDTFALTTNQVPTFPLLDATNLPYPLSVLLNQNALTFASIGLVFLLWYALFKTKFGLAIRAVGEDPRVAASVGINVGRARYLCSILGSAIAAVGGVFVVLGLTGSWAGDVTAGRGFIAIAMVRVGLYRPVPILIACLLFGFVDAAQLTLQVSASGFPHQFLQMAPYLMGIVALIISGRFKVFGGPASLGRPYEKEQR